MSTGEKLSNVLNRLCKWRSVFAGWQLGTRSNSDPECKAVRDHREVTMLLRAEVSALLATLEKRDPGFLAQFDLQLIEEAEALNLLYEKKFPGMKATDIGIDMDVPVAAKTMSGWRP